MAEWSKAISYSHFDELSLSRRGFESKERIYVLIIFLLFFFLFVVRSCFVLSPACPFFMYLVTSPFMTRLSGIIRLRKRTSCFYWKHLALRVLGHLSRRLIWWAYRIGRPSSSVVRRPRPSYVFCRRPHSLNIFSSETTGPIKVKFHMELLWDGGRKVCSKGPGQMTKMAAMLIYGRNLKKSSSLEPKGRWPWNLVRIIGCSYYQVCSDDDPRLTLTYFTARSNLVPYAFVWEKGKTMHISLYIINTIVFYNVNDGRCS